MKTLKQRQIETGRTLALNSKAWGLLRARVLDAEPLCRMCKEQGRIVAATDVDHINNDPTDNRMEALQPLCHECHSRKTAADHGKRVTYGCDASGTPADPSHYWNQAAVRDPGARQSDKCQKSPATHPRTTALE